MKILVIPCSMSSRYLFEGALSGNELFFCSRTKLKTKLNKMDNLDLVILDSRFQDTYGIHIFKELEDQVSQIPKLVIAECEDIRNEFRNVSMHGKYEHNYIIHPPRIKYLRDLSGLIVERKGSELCVNQESQIIKLADAIDDVEEITRAKNPDEHFLRVKELAEELYALFNNEMPIERGILNNISYLHDVNRTRIENNILQDLEFKEEITEKDYFHVFCGVGELDTIVNTMPGWGHFFLEDYETYRKKELNLYKKSEMDIVPSDLVAVADAYDIYERKFREEGKDFDRPMIIKELKETDILNPIVLDSLSKAA